MAHSREIIVKCPACSEKFEAERQEEAIFLSCPACDMQVKISGLEDPRSRRSRRLPRIDALPAPRPGDSARISDLSQTESEIDRPLASPRIVAKSPRATPSFPEEEKGVRPSLSGRERRLARELAKVVELKRQIARQGRRRETSSEDLPDALAENEDALMRTHEPAMADRPEETGDGAIALEKVQIGPSGERRRLHDAPVAEVPAPRSRGASIHAETVDLARRRDEIIHVPTPAQPFESRQITRGSIWKRHKPDRSETPRWEGEQARDEQHRRRRRRSKVRRLLIGVAGLGCLALGWYGSKVWKQSNTLEKTEMVVVPKDEHYVSVLELFEQAKPVVEGFLAADSIESAQPYLRNAEKVGYLMKKHYLDSGYESVAVSEIGPGLSCELFEGILVVPVTLQNFEERGLAYDIATGKVDWESWAGYSEMRFPEMRLRRPAEPILVRCYLTQDAYFNYGFSDPDRYLSFKLVDSSREHHLWGYVDKTAAVYREVAAGLVEIQGTGPTNMATLRVKYPEEFSPSPTGDQVLITELLTLGWVVREPISEDPATAQLTGEN